MSYLRNGYVMFYKPDHHRAGTDGMVYEHVYLAEQYIGRPLEYSEVVHHEDRNRSNNTEDNLFVFKTDNDHTRYHKTGIMEKLPDGSYISPVMEKTCKTCNKKFIAKKIIQDYCSVPCADKERGLTRRVVKDRPSKEELEALIKTKSFTQIGKDYGVSDNAIRKWCKSYNLPYKKKDILAS